MKKFNFYGRERFKRSGKHPNEFVSENVELKSFAKAKKYAENLSKSWQMDVEYFEMFDKEKFFVYYEVNQ